MSAIGFDTHNHAACIEQALENAHTHCARHKLQFTPVRRRVLEILLQRHQALGAYEILDILTQEGLGSQPPVAYRALDFLVKNGLAHRIEQVNAYTACAHPGQDHIPAFLVCRSCKAVAEAETDMVKNRLNIAAQASGFKIETIVVEAQGLCPACCETAE